MWTYNYPNTLYHYGVKGMKWGVRHDKPGNGTHPQYATKAMEREILRQVRAETDFSSGSRNNKVQDDISKRNKKKQSKTEMGSMPRAYKKALKKDVKLAKKQGINYEVKYDKSSGEVYNIQAYIGADKKISEKRLQEIHNVIDNQRKRRYRTLAGASTVAMGTAVAYEYLRRY